MSLENSIRIFLGIFGALAVLFGPAWLPVVPMVLLSIRFRAWEAMVLGLFMDFMWLPWFGVPMFLILSIILVWIFEPLRKELLLA